MIFFSPAKIMAVSSKRVEKRLTLNLSVLIQLGELHLGHARIAAIGDVICRLYEARGYEITREYYVNDAGVPNK